MANKEPNGKKADGGQGQPSRTGANRTPAARRRTGAQAGRGGGQTQSGGLGAFLKNNIILVGTGVIAVAVIVVALVFIRPQTANAGFPFPCLSSESTALHTHPYVKISIDGEPVTIPAEVGITSCFEPVHTHDTTGIIHLEGPDPSMNYTLADFITIWRVTYQTANIGGKSYPVEFTPSSFFGHPIDATHEVQVLVDGQSAGAPDKVILTHLDFCNSKMTTPPCFPTAVSEPYPPSVAKEYGSEHTIEIKYVTKK